MQEQSTMTMQLCKTYVEQDIVVKEANLIRVET